MKLNVLYQFDELYAPYAGISMTSLFENNKEAEEIVVYALVDHVNKPSIERLLATARQYGRKIEFIDTKNIVKMMKEVGIPKYRNSYTTNMKLFLPYFIHDIERIVYIDCDTIIAGPITNLMEIEMNNCPVGMVLDSLCGRHRCRIGLKHTDGYFNAGVILIDYKKWVEEKCTDKILLHVKNVRAHYFAPDQDLINIILKGQIFRLDLSFNLQPIHKAFSFESYNRLFKKSVYYTGKEVKHAVKNPRIIHTFRFLGEFPWHQEENHPYTEIFDFYMKKSQWSDYQKAPSNQKGFLFKAERYLYKKLKPSIFLILFKWSYEIFLWKADWDSKNSKTNKSM